jgi:hypothetical protein
MMRRRWWIAAVAAVAVAAVTATGIALAGREDGLAQRQAEVAAKGQQVMPFDLERTTHRFIKTATGGVQTVIADDPTDDAQIKLIRKHVAEENVRFGQGDFGDPATIHGSEMPGLAELSKGYRQITTTYTDLSDGGRITYATSDPELVKALHAWFDAQTSDHGDHAEAGQT